MSDIIKEEEIRKKKKEIAENYPALMTKDLFSMLTERELDKLIVGEIESRKVILLCAMGCLVQNAAISSYNLLVNDVAGAGKDYITNATLKLMPEHRYLKRTRISPTVFTYWHNSKYEPNWTWDGKVLYLEDVANTILNSSVFKVMCSSGSHATIVKDQRAIDIKIVGKPVMIITSATATPNPELTRRFTILNLDSGENQTKAIIKRHLEFAEKGVSPELDGNILESLQQLTQIKVKVPFASKLFEFFPVHNVIMRTHILRFIDYIKASCALYQWQREIDEEGYYIATEQDYQIAKGALVKTTSNEYMIPLTKDQRRIMEVFEKNKDLWYTIPELESKVTWMSERWLRKTMDKLADYGLIVKELQENDLTNRKNMVFAFNQCSITNVQNLPDKLI